MRAKGLTLLEVIVAFGLLFILITTLFNGLSGSRKEDYISGESLDMLFNMQSVLEELSSENADRLPLTDGSITVIEYSGLLEDAGLDSLYSLEEDSEKIVIKVETDGFVKTVTLNANVYKQYPENNVETQKSYRKEISLATAFSLSPNG